MIVLFRMPVVNCNSCEKAVPPSWAYCPFCWQETENKDSPVTVQDGIMMGDIHRTSITNITSNESSDSVPLMGFWISGQNDSDDGSYETGTVMNPSMEEMKKIIEDCVDKPFDGSRYFIDFGYKKFDTHLPRLEYRGNFFRSKIVCTYWRKSEEWCDNHFPHGIVGPFYPGDLFLSSEDCKYSVSFLLNIIKLFIEDDEELKSIIEWEEATEESVGRADPRHCKTCGFYPCRCDSSVVVD